MARIVARQRFFSNNWGMNDGRMISPQKPSNPFRHGISHSRELCSLLLVAANQPSPAVQSSMNHPVSVSSCIYYPTLVSRLICRLPRSHRSLTIDLHTYSYHRVITSTSSDQREITFAFVSYSYDLCIDSRQSKEQM